MPNVLQSRFESISHILPALLVLKITMNQQGDEDIQAKRERTLPADSVDKNMEAQVARIVA